jgi:hypothetical protein
MRKTLTLALALGAAAALLAADAGALPMAQAMQTGADVTLVREGCGPGRQYSERLRRCVADTPRAAIRDVVRPRECGPHRHYSARFRRCVRN